MAFEGSKPYRIAPTSGSASNQDVIGSERQSLVDTLHGQHYADCLAGRVFTQGATPLGLAIPIYSATAIAGGMPIWNPPGSGVNVEMVSVTLAYASGTSGYGAIGCLVRSLTQIATGSAMTALAATTPKNGLALAGNTTKVQSSNAGACTVTAGVAGDWFRTLASMNLEAATGTAHGLIVPKYDFDGTLILPPGTLWYLAATVASVALIASEVTWKETAI